MADDTQSEKPKRNWSQKASDWLGRNWGWCKRNWLWPVLIITMIVIALIVAVIVFWDDLSEELSGPEDGGFRLITILAGAAAFAVAVWRSSTAAKQAKSTEKQIELATKGQYSERFVAAVEQVASEELAIRLGGLASLDALSGETANEYERVWNYLGNFLRYPPALGDWSSEEEDKTDSGEMPIGKRPDIAAIAGMIRKSKEKQKEWGKKFPLPLHQANLQGADLHGANLQGAILPLADLQEADLRDADLQDAILQAANLHQVKLQGADLQDAKLQDAVLLSAKLQGTKLQGTNLRRAILQNAILQGAHLQGAQLIGALFGSDSEQDLRECKNLTPEQLKGTWYDQENSAPILPDGWPEDCKPRPIGWGEWIKKKKEFMEKLLKIVQG